MQNEAQFGKGAVDKPEDYFGPRAWRHEEIAGASPKTTWVEKNPQGGFVTYPKRNQGQQFSCVLYVKAKQLSVDELSENGTYRELSPRSVYPYVVVPGGGSSSLNAARLVTKIGMTLEHLLPTDGLSEQEVVKDKGYVTDAKQVALVYKPGSFVECSADFETLAGILESYKARGVKKVIGVTVIGRNNGTWTSMFPTPPKPTDGGLWYHRVAVTDYGLINGKPHIAIDNSWGENVGFKGQQYLSSDYESAIYGGIYTLNMPDNWQQMSSPDVPMPKYQWYSDLAYGSRGAEVTVLQEALQSLGMFPISKVLKPTGNYYGLTQKCVEVFQQSFALPVTGKVDARTREELNKIFK